MVSSFWGCNIKSDNVEVDKIIKKAKIQIVDQSDVHDFLCKKKDINEIMIDSILSNCLDMKLYDEQCLEDIVSEDFCRLFVVDRNQVKILSVTKLSSCWMKTIKVIKRESYGVFGYLVNSKDVKFNVKKSLTDIQGYSKLKSISNTFHSKNSRSRGEVLYVIDLVEGKNRSKFYSSSDILEKEQIKEINLLFNTTE